jgi:hypothetical protein
MQQNHPDNTLPDSKLMNCKRRRCEYVQELQKQLSAILPTFRTKPISRANTFTRSLVSSPTLALLQAMPPHANLQLNWLATSAAEKVYNQSNLPQQNRSTPLSTHFWNLLAQSAFVLLHHQLSSYSENLPLQNLPPSL